MVDFKNLIRLLPFSLLLGICITTHADAKDKSKTDQKKTSTSKSVSKTQLESWVNQLGEGEFRLRRIASNNLSKAGKQALPTLVNGAKRKDSELSARCVEIIIKMYKGKNETLKSAAEKALGDLEKSSNMSVAQRANHATKKPEEIDRLTELGLTDLTGIVVLRNGNAQRRILIHVVGLNVNGNWNKKILENGKTISIKKKNGAISIDVTETVKGKLQTKKYKAKNESELKKKHPDLFKLYKKHDRLKNVVMPVLNPIKLNIEIEKLKIQLKELKPLQQARKES